MYASSHNKAPTSYPASGADLLSPTSEIIVTSGATLEAAATAFWSFSNRIYAIKEVAEACIDLQDRCGLDVNLVLLCLWTALSGGMPMGRVRTITAINTSSHWQNKVVSPLRQARRTMKGGVAGVSQHSSESLRDRIKALELDAEQIEQKTLSSLFKELKKGSGPLLSQPLEARTARAAANFATLLDTLGRPRDAQDCDAFATLLCAVAPCLSRPVAKQLVG